MKSKLLVTVMVFVILIVTLIPGEITEEQKQNESRTERCLECAKECLQQSDVRELVTVKKHIGYVIIGASFAFGILAGLIVAWAYPEVGTKHQKTLYVSLAASVGMVAMKIVLEIVTDPVVDYLHRQMAELGCTCAIYCGDFL
jgi:hypothetical protein